MKALGYLTFGIIVIVAGTIYSGWVFQHLWEWFVVPTFNLSPLRLPAAIGLTSVVTYLTHQFIREPKDERDTTEKLCNVVVIAFLKPTLVIFFGWIVKQWM